MYKQQRLSIRFSWSGLAILLVLLGSCASTGAPDNEQAFTRSVDDPAIEWAPCPEFMPEGCRLAVLHGDPAEPNADIFIRFPGNSTVPHHWHTSAERMVLISGELHVDYDGQEAVVMHPGVYAYGPASLPHSAVCRSDDPCVLFIAFEEPIDATATEN